jgi:hypothetical protein
MQKSKSSLFMLIALLSLTSLLLAACGNTTQTSSTTEAPPEAEAHEDTMEDETSSEGDHNEVGETGTDEADHAEDSDEADHDHDEESEEGDHAHAEVPHEYEDLMNPFEKPATLADAEMMADVTDGYLVWRITEGGIGEPFNSAMPAWGETFNEEQIWQLVSFVRSLSQ